MGLTRHTFTSGVRFLRDSVPFSNFKSTLEAVGYSCISSWPDAKTGATHYLFTSSNYPAVEAVVVVVGVDGEWVTTAYEPSQKEQRSNKPKRRDKKSERRWGL